MSEHLLGVGMFVMRACLIEMCGIWTHWSILLITYKDIKTITAGFRGKKLQFYFAPDTATFWVNSVCTKHEQDIIPNKY